jgi:hypothetical protein
MTSAIFWPLFTEAIKRAIRSKYAWTFLCFIILQAAFLISVQQRWIPGTMSEMGIEDAQTTFFICSVHLLLALNTYFFLDDVLPLISAIRQNAPRDSIELRHIRHANQAFLGGLMSCVFASGALSIIVVLGWFGALSQSHWKLILECSEFVSGFVFLFFVFADLSCLESALRGLRLPAEVVGFDREEVGRLVRTLTRYILAVDVPGAVGLWLIIVWTRFLFPDFIQAMFWQGFVAGAVGLHIMFSQAALAFLSLIEEG